MRGDKTTTGRESSEVEKTQGSYWVRGEGSWGGGRCGESGWGMRGEGERRMTAISSPTNALPDERETVSVSIQLCACVCLCMSDLDG